MTMTESSAGLWAAQGGFRDIFDLASAAISAIERGDNESAHTILVTLAYRADAEGDAADTAFMTMEAADRSVWEAKPQYGLRWSED